MKSKNMRASGWSSSDVPPSTRPLSGLSGWGGQAVVVDCVPDQRSTHQTIGMIDATWTSIVEPHGDGSKLKIEVDYTLPGAVFGKLAEHLTVRRMERDLNSSLLNIKEILEG